MSTLSAIRAYAGPERLGFNINSYFKKVEISINRLTDSNFAKTSTIDRAINRITSEMVNAPKQITNKSNF